jgi:peptidoglycan/xylan/chitin deacetylase (PgdA/CDA1 family)
MKDTVLHASKRIGLFRLARLITRRRLRILCYHGFEIADESICRPQLFLGLDVFADRMEQLASGRYPVLPLAEAVERLAAGTLPAAAVVITIDDGFYAVRSGAAAILQAHRFPATVYVPTYYVEKDAPIFRFVVRYMFARAAGVRRIPRHSWLPDGADRLDDPAVRERTVDAVIEFGERRCPEPERQRICRELGQALGVDYEAIRGTRILSLMNQHELREMRSFGIDVQLHTHRHRFPLVRDAADAEIIDNRRALERLLGTSGFDHLCYPSGVYDRSQWPWLSALGVKTATTCEAGLNDARTPALGLRRFLDHPDVSPITFEAELSGFLELARRMRAFVRRALQPTGRGRRRREARARTGPRPVAAQEWPTGY